MGSSKKQILAALRKIGRRICQLKPNNRLAGKMPHNLCVSYFRRDNKQDRITHCRNAIGD
jgi:hypothetical protein